MLALCIAFDHHYREPCERGEKCRFHPVVNEFQLGVAAKI